MEYVDLGLPSGNLWATCNVGASKSYKYGKYYNYDEALDLQTNKELLPSKEDWEELKNNCTFTWTTRNGVSGASILGTNGNNIFLPAAGEYSGSSYFGDGKYGDYQSSTLYTSCMDTNYNFCLNADRNTIYWDSNLNKKTIRLIKKKNNMEKRKIEIDINTAKEWYNSNNESLKTVALQAFSEQELKDGLPKTWEEYATSNKDKLLYYINGDSECKTGGLLPNKYCKNSLNTKKDAEAHLALMQLHVLRDAYRDYYQKGWQPDYYDIYQNKYAIFYKENSSEIDTLQCTSRFLSFPTKELANQFLENFKDLIEKAKDLI